MKTRIDEWYFDGDTAYYFLRGIAQATANPETLWVIASDYFLSAELVSTDWVTPTAEEIAQASAFCARDDRPCLRYRFEVPENVPLPENFFSIASAV